MAKREDTAARAATSAAVQNTLEEAVWWIPVLALDLVLADGCPAGLSGGGLQQLTVEETVADPICTAADPEAWARAMRRFNGSL